MSDFDISNPSPDDGHEAIRQAVVDALEELGYASDDAGLSLDMADTLFLLIENLAARVAALEPQGPTVPDGPE